MDAFLRRKWGLSVVNLMDPDDINDIRKGMSPSQQEEHARNCPFRCDDLQEEVMAMKAGPVREHGGHYKRRYVHVRTAQNLNLDMDLYLAGELSERNMTLKAREFAAVQANAVNTSLDVHAEKDAGHADGPVRCFPKVLFPLVLPAQSRCQEGKGDRSYSCIGPGISSHRGFSS